MNKKLVLAFPVLILVIDLVIGAPKANSKRVVHEYGPPIQISSSVFSIQQDEGSLHEDTDAAGEYLVSHGEYDGIETGDDHHAGSNGYLQFAGIVGSGHIYVPDDSGDHFGKINDGILSISQC